MATSPDGVSPDELKQTLLDRLKGPELDYFLESCTKSRVPPEEYFIGLAQQTGVRAQTASRLVTTYPTAAAKFIELNDLLFQHDKLAVSSIIDELVAEGYDRDVLNDPSISKSYERLLLIAFDAFYDAQTETLSQKFEVMVGRAQIRHERTEARYPFDASLPYDDTSAIAERIDQFETDQNTSGTNLAVWHGTTDAGVWMKLFKQRNRRSEYVFENSSEDTAEPPSITTQSRFPVKTFAAEVREADQGIIVHTYDDLEQSRMKSTFRDFLRELTRNPTAIDSFDPIESTQAKSLVTTAVEEAKKAVEGEADEGDVVGTVQNQMDDMTEQVLAELDTEDEEDEDSHIEEQLADGAPVFVGIDILGDEQTGIDQFRVRSADSFAKLGGQFEKFDDATHSLLREVNKENIELVFRLPDVHSDSHSFFTASYGDWSDVRGVSREAYETIDRLLGEINE